MEIELLEETVPLISATPSFKAQANLSDPNIYKHSKENRLSFWEDQAEKLTWFKKWDTTFEWKKPYSQWFKGGKLNASFNCLDVHLETKKNKKALIWEGENGTIQSFTYEELHQKVCQLAFQLRHQLKVKKQDRVTIYMPMIPELVIAVLACARIGAIHSVVFGGFSASSLKDRIEDSESTLLITADGGYRRGKIIPLQEIVESAVSEGCHSLNNILIVNYINPTTPPNLNSPHQVTNYLDIMKESPLLTEAEPMESEDKLFILYTSGTTGKPKGIIHSTGGYLTHAKYSTHTVFDLKDNDVFWCTADIGWITGHTYLVYGPLTNGATVFMYEGTPDFPEKNCYWDLIERHKISIFYTAPTAIRCFIKWGNDPIQKHDLSSLRLLGSVGEPINPEVWMWYYKIIGGERCPIVDTWWQTETGGIMISTLPALNPMKPGTAGYPLPGITAKILNQDGSEVQSGGGLLSLTEPWPSMLRGVWGDPDRYKETYWSTFDTYFAGDGATVDENGYVKILGRVDDVLNVAGHRIGTMEVESHLVEHPQIAEAAVVGIPDEIKGQAIAAFIILKEGCVASSELETEVIQFIRNKIGAIATPKKIVFTPELPKTRSGKIMRRVLKAIGENAPVGDISTLANPEIVNYLSKPTTNI